MLIRVAATRVAAGGRQGAWEDQRERAVGKAAEDAVGRSELVTGMRFS
jgi:hypothetical protein